MQKISVSARRGAFYLFRRLSSYNRLNFSRSENPAKLAWVHIPVLRFAASHNDTLQKIIPAAVTIATPIAPYGLTISIPPTMVMTLLTIVIDIICV